ncbi:hypothetical protein MAHJHV61_45470 [Mycobacterium avium subsp. hominissuis]
MVGHRHQHMLILVEAEKLCAQRDFAAQVESVAGYRVDGVVQPARRPSVGVNHPPADVGLFGGDDDLVRCAVADGEHGTQALVPGDHVGQRGAQRRNIKRPL